MATVVNMPFDPEMSQGNRRCPVKVWGQRQFEFEMKKT